MSARRPRTNKPERGKDKGVELGQATKERINEEGTTLTKGELVDVQDRRRLRAVLIYEIIRQEGEEELARPAISLWWSGVAAGIAMGFSVVAKGLLHASLPAAPWTHLVTSLGYSVGFVIVIMSRQQLFTENTISVILPLLANCTLENLAKTARLWGLVLAANLVGTMVFAAALFSGWFLAPDITDAIHAISVPTFELSPLEMMLKGIVAGWLIATLVWLLPVAETAQLWLTILLTSIISAAGLTHVVAGSTEAFLLLFRGDISWQHAIFGFMLPTLLGNILGGTALFSMIAYGQVKEEM